MKKKKKKSRLDVNQLAHRLVQEATDSTDQERAEPAKPKQDKPTPPDKKK